MSHDLQSLFNQEIKYLKNAVQDGSSDYHTFSLATLQNKSPELRTIVLRGVQESPFKIYFNADYRSPKVQELIKHQNCSALFYDKNRRVQIRLRCTAMVHYQNKTSQEVWNKTALQSKKCYMGPFAPSMQLDNWHPNIPMEYLKSDPDPDSSEKGYINFAHIELEVLESDVLHLHHDGHIRFKADSKGDLFYVSP